MVSDNIRNLAIVGHLHHGKTSFVDCLVEQTHNIKWNSTEAFEDETNSKRYTDISKLERDRGLSVKAQPMSLLLQDLRGKSYVMNIIDTPGHVDFIGEVASSLRLADGAVILVDAVEGLMINTERVIKMLIESRTPFFLVVNKIDRLILELKLPPSDAYHKLRHVIEQVNTFISTCVYDWEKYRISPELGNVCFASARYNFAFTLRSFAEIYADLWSDSKLNTDEFSKRLWGNIFYSPESKGFSRKAKDNSMKRTFIHFILEPLYKIFTHVLGQENAELKQTLKELGIHVRLSDFEMDVKPLLRHVLSQFFGDFGAFVDICTKQLPSPAERAVFNVRNYYRGPLTGDAVQSMIECNANGPLIVHACKMYPTPDRSKFDVFGKIVSGTAKKGQRVRVLGEDYSPEDDEDMSIQEVSHVWIHESRYRIEVPELSAGNWVLLGGVDETISKTATIVSMSLGPNNEEAYCFRPIKFPVPPVFKIAIEPLNPSELPKMLEGLRKLTKFYPLASTKVEESGEHILLATGEFHMDCMLHDLRETFSEIEIRVSDPVVKFCETVVETSAIKCFAESPNRKNKITMVAEPLEKGVSEDIESEMVIYGENGDIRKRMESFFEEKYGWDILATRGLWAFGPYEQGPNVLIDDTLPDEVDKDKLEGVKESIKQGFQWGTREGPLCDEPIRNVKFKILDAVLAPERINRAGGQLIPTSRRVVYSSFLMATPRIMEPMYKVEILVSSDAINSVYKVLSRRRGHATQDVPCPGSPLHKITAFIPLIDSFGFETDLRTHTGSTGFCQAVFDHYQVVPGDPLDKNIEVRPLEPASHTFEGGSALARDFMVKTRRRKGLSEDVSVAKYFDDPMLLELAKHDILGGTDLL